MAYPYYRLVLAFIMVLSAPLSWAAIKINVTGTVVEGGCIINNGEPISIDFGNNLQAHQLNGDNFIKNIDYTLTCDDISSFNVEMQLNGTASQFNDHYLATNRTGLGIKLYMEGKPMPLNTWMPFTLPHIPVLQAAPIKSDSTEIETGVFSASATLQIQYQ